jgi:hypothetical protein
VYPHTHTRERTFLSLIRLSEQCANGYTLDTCSTPNLKNVNYKVINEKKKNPVRRCLGFVGYPLRCCSPCNLLQLSPSINHTRRYDIHDHLPYGRLARPTRFTRADKEQHPRYPNFTHFWMH